MKWSLFLITIRWQNVFLIWLMQIVVFFQYVLPYCGNENYSFSSLILFLVATGAVLGAGNIYNDIRDIHTDAVHPAKPGLVGYEISISRAWNWYLILTGMPILILIAGVLVYDWPILLIAIFIIGIISLYVYSSYLKSSILVGNFLIAILCGLSVWMTTLLLPECGLGTDPEWTTKIPLVVYGYIANAFVITLLREIVKDKEDASSDIKYGIFTIGSISESSFRLVFNGILIFHFLLNGYWFYNLRSVLTPPNWNLGLLFIYIPLVLIALIFNRPHRPKVYSFLSKLIKVYILFAILLLILWQRH